MNKDGVYSYYKIQFRPDESQVKGEAKATEASTLPAKSDHWADLDVPGFLRRHARTTLSGLALEEKLALYRVGFIEPWENCWAVTGRNGYLARDLAVGAYNELRRLEPIAPNVYEFRVVHRAISQVTTPVVVEEEHPLISIEVADIFLHYT